MKAGGFHAKRCDVAETFELVEETLDPTALSVESSIDGRLSRPAGMGHDVAVAQGPLAMKARSGPAS